MYALQWSCIYRGMLDISASQSGLSRQTPSGDPWMMCIWSLSTSSQQQNILTHRDRTLQFCSGSRSDSSPWIIFKFSVLADSGLLCYDEQHFDVCPAYPWDWLEVWNTAGWRGWVSDSFLAEDSTLQLPEPGGEQRVQECVRQEQGGWDYGFFCGHHLPDDVRGARVQLSFGRHLALTVSWDTPGGRMISVLT